MRQTGANAQVQPAGNCATTALPMPCPAARGSLRAVLITPPPAVTRPVAPARTAETLPAVATESIPAAELSAILRSHRESLGLNQRQAAAALGISQGHYSKLERGTLVDHTPTRTFRERLATWLAKRTP